MSGISTNERFAILDSSRGLGIRCFKTPIDLAKGAVYELRSCMDDASISRWLCDLADEIEADGRHTAGVPQDDDMGYV